MNPIVFICVGIITGLTIGIIGIGSGILLIPILTYLGVSVKTAVATGLALQVVPQSLPGLIMYHQNDHVDWRLCIYTILGSMIGITLGSYLVNKNFITEKMMYVLLFIILFFSTIYIGIKIKNNYL